MESRGRKGHAAVLPVYRMRKQVYNENWKRKRENKIEKGVVGDACTGKEAVS
jgi:hypothetical protein